MAFTREQYDKLVANIATATKAISYGDKTVTRHSLAEMLRLKKLMEAELFPNQSPRRRRYAETDRGFFPGK